MTDKIDNGSRRAKRQKYFNTGASVGILIIAVALGLPIINLGDGEYTGAYKWVYAAGALIYLVAKIAGATDGSGSVRMRRLRRMQAWGGVAFAVAAAMWFYTESRIGAMSGILAILRQTILFSLVGAMIEIISSWLMYSQQKKERKSGE